MSCDMYTAWHDGFTVLCAWNIQDAAQQPRIENGMMPPHGAHETALFSASKEHSNFTHSKMLPYSHDALAEGNPHDVRLIQRNWKTSANSAVETSDCYMSVLSHVAVQMRWKRE